MKTKAETLLKNRLANAFEDWWAREGADLTECARDSETKGTMSAFLAGARAQRKIDQQRPRRPLP